MICPTLRWHNVSKPITCQQIYPLKFYSWIQTNTVKLLIIIDNNLQFLERVSCMVSSLSEL